MSGSIPLVNPPRLIPRSLPSRPPYPGIPTNQYLWLRQPFQSTQVLPPNISTAHTIYNPVPGSSQLGGFVPIYSSSGETSLSHNPIVSSQVTATNPLYSIFPQQQFPAAQQSTFCAPPPDYQLSLSMQSSPLHSLVPQKLKEKIWEDEFINLSALVKGPEEDAKQDYVLTEVKEDGTYESIHINLNTNNTKKGRILAFPEWIRAFIMYISIYSIRFPDQTPHLLKHMVAVTELFQKHQGWRVYDEKF
ncbi:unnamed protein product [Owenia fusiformis]|uniref:Uncharacterized protein n=1 Tax=Owenia fusiformis TaxID=6347 RepID=A0A8S4NVI0_OWEFU|nr:unnamed protein product [Owenia fusiformis]